MKTALLFALFMCAFFHNITAQQSEQDINLNVTIHQSSNLANASSGEHLNGQCSFLSGKDRKQCMANLSKEELKITFFALNSRAAKNYITELNDTEKREFLNNFTQDEWLSWWNNLDPETQKTIPMTLQEQHKQLDQRAQRSAYYLESCAVVLSRLICYAVTWASKLLLG